MSFRAKLYMSMAFTLALFVAITSLVLALILTLLNFNLVFIIGLVIAFNVFEWMMAPYFIDAIYHVRSLRREEYPWLHEIVEHLARRMDIKTPKLMLAQISIPNAFAYGSPLTGPRVAVTRGLLENLDREEIEAVLGHELGHLKHHDVGVMMFLSLIPSMFFLIARYAMFATFLGGGDSRDRGGGIAALIVVALVSYLVYFVLILLLLRHSRLREYFADYESSINVPLGARKLAAALARISVVTSGLGKRVEREIAKAAAFKALLIADPEEYRVNVFGHTHNWEQDYQLALRIASERRKSLSWFSTHPPLHERLRRLIELDRELSGRPDYYNR